ncbi:MAG: FAD-dependent monooxygenase [Pseudomonadota bacterium]
MSDRADVFISGGGIAGLMAALLFGRAGFQVICVDPVPPVTDREAPGADLRSTAFLQPARRTLEKAGIWPHVATYATPLQVMRLLDVSTSPPKCRDFDARDVSTQPFGWNLPNWLMRRELLNAIDDAPNVELRVGVGLAALREIDGSKQARVVDLSDGTAVQAPLVIGADGRDSPTRKAIGVQANRVPFGQKALAFAVTHPEPHQNVSTEVHDTGGPFTLVPLADVGDQHASAIVWMDRAEVAEAMMALDTAAFELAMTERSHQVQGPLKLASQRTIWPIITQLSERFFGPRVALVAEAAHVVPPIGAQGLNMSLADLAALCDLARTYGTEGLGSEQMLRRYHSARFADVAARLAGIFALNQASMLKLPLLRQARAHAMTGLHDLPPLRRTLMRLGLGAQPAR